MMEKNQPYKHQKTVPIVQVLSGTAPRGTIRGRLFNRDLVRKWARFLLLVWLIFFHDGAKSCRFSGLAFGCVFHAFLGQASLEDAGAGHGMLRFW